MLKMDQEKPAHPWQHTQHRGFSCVFSLPLSLFFWLHRAAGRYFVLQTGMETAPPAVEARILNHWTASEVPSAVFLETQTIFVSRALKPTKMRPQRAGETGHLTPIP